MDTEFLVQMRQSNKCGSVRNDEIFNLHLGSGAGPSVAITAAAEKTLGIKLKQKPCVNKKIILKCQAATRFIKIQKTNDKPLYEKKQINRKNTRSCKYRRSK